jgi:hypothetical protein
VPPSCVQVPFLAVPADDLRFGGVLGPFRLPRAADDPPNAASELTGSATGRCGASSALQCVRGVFAVDSDAKRRRHSVSGALAPSGGRVAVAATNNLMTDLYSANEMSGLWPGLRPLITGSGLAGASRPQKPKKTENALALGLGGINWPPCLLTADISCPSSYLLSSILLARVAICCVPRSAVRSPTGVAAGSRRSTAVQCLVPSSLLPVAGGSWCS